MKGKWENIEYRYCLLYFFSPSVLWKAKGFRSLPGKNKNPPIRTLAPEGGSDEIAVLDFYWHWFNVTKILVRVTSIEITLMIVLISVIMSHLPTSWRMVIAILRDCNLTFPCGAHHAGNSTPYDNDTTSNALPLTLLQGIALPEDSSNWHFS